MPPRHPDSNLHPTATGPAARIVAAHHSPEPLKLYSGWFCPFVQRVWAVLEEKKIPYQYIEVNPYDKPASLLALNPRGLVPTLEVKLDDGARKPLYESNVVCEFLEEAYPGDDGDGDGGRVRLLPEDSYERARCRIWMDFCGSRIVPAFHRFLQWQPPAGGEKDGDKGGLGIVREEFLKTLKEFAKEMLATTNVDTGDTDTNTTGPFFLGANPSLIDFVIAPWIVRLWVFDTFKEGGVGIPAVGEGGDDEVLWARLRSWKDAVEGRASIRDTLSEREHYLPIYKRYADDTAMSEMAKASRAGRGVP
jgi:glutathione S-transferase